MKKKLLSVVLTVSMVIGLISANAVSISYEDIEEQESNIYFEDIEVVESEKDEPIQFEIAQPEKQLILQTHINDFSPLATNEISTYSNDSWNFSYTGTVQEFIAPYTGKYFIDAYGASGGNASTTKGGTGGNTCGYYNLKKDDVLYLVIGEKGKYQIGGWNGGGNASNAYGGGGSTFISLTNRGVLTNYQTYVDELLLVAGGGGGAGSNMLDYGNIIGSGGGLNGGASTRYSQDSVFDWFKPATQEKGSGYAFGIGGQGINGAGAGGGGYYGGLGLRDEKGGGNGGSGYISDNLEFASSNFSNHIGNGKVTINYEGQVKSTITMKLNQAVMINNQNETLILEGNANDTIKLEPKEEEGYSIIGWNVTRGDAEFQNNVLKFGFKDSTIEPIYIAPLKLEQTVGNNGIISLNYQQKDNISKIFRIYQSTNNSNWYLAESNEAVGNRKTYVEKFIYRGYVESFTAPVSNLYKIKLYGASGGKAIAQGQLFQSTSTGGYTEGYVNLSANETIYIAVGGVGGNGVINGYGSGGWNGGGKGSNDGGGYGASVDDEASAGGGGATSVTTKNRGELKNFTSYKDEVLAVAGGGGGSSYYYVGGNGGGTFGGPNGTRLTASQSSGYSFGKGQDGYGTADSDGVGGGGGGWYGGYAVNVGGQSNGGGGSGYTGGLIDGRTTSSTHQGHGYAEIECIDLTIDGNCFNNVIMQDKANPNKPSFTKVSSNKNKLTLTYESSDNGTDYYHRVESYNAETDEVLSTSNTLKHNYASGIKGYYYYMDNNKNGIATTTDTFTSLNSIEIPNNISNRYIHIIAIDNSGNISETTTYEIPSIANYTVKHYKMDLDGNYILDETEIKSDTIGINVTPTTKSYAGFTSPQPITKTILADGSTEIDYYYTRNKYPVIYIDKNSQGTELGRTEKQVFYETDVRGSDIGSNTADNAYYPQYSYVSDTSGTVGTSTITVYRIFEFCETEKESHLTWNDNNNADGLRPSKYTLKLKQNGKVIDEVELPSSQTDYTFENLPKYDTNGNSYKYELDTIASERYKFSIDRDGNQIQEDYLPSSFNVKIPKNIILNGKTGNADYTVIVNGIFYYHDILTVKPDASFTMIDRNSISSMQANVTQSKTSFSKEDLKPNSIASGHIQVNRTYFSGIWQGSYHFNIKFVRKN